LTEYLVFSQTSVIHLTEEILTLNGEQFVDELVGELESSLVLGGVLVGGGEDTGDP
jgi:hypothetical protein